MNVLDLFVYSSIQSMFLNSFLHKKFFSTLQYQYLLPPKSSLLVSFSGGQDSLTLIKLLYDFQDLYQWNITLIHFDHRWRVDSVQASKQIFNYAKFYNYKLYYFECPYYLDSEEASRRWRYSTLIKIACRYNFHRILLAHTATDKAETLFGNLCRGTGLDGLSSIAWLSQLSQSLYIVRPLLNIYRHETSWFCRRYCLPIWVDQTNYNYFMSRNRLRQELIPYIKSYFQPRFEERCYSLSSLVTLDADFLEQEAARIYFCIQHREIMAINYLVLKLLHPSIQSRIIKLFFVSNLDFNPNFKQISDMIIFINQSKVVNINIKNHILGIDSIWLYVGMRL